MRKFVLLILIYLGLSNSNLVLSQKELEEVSEEHLDEDPVLGELAYQYGQKGFINQSKNLDSAEFYLNEALRIQYSIYNYHVDERVAINHVTLASVYRKMHNNREALRHLNEAEKILQATDPDNILFTYIYHNKGNIYKTINDFYRTKEYYQYALDFLKKHGYSDAATEFAHVYANLINLLFELGENDLAEEELNSLDVSKLELTPQVNISIYLTKAYSYSLLGENDSAIEYYKKTYDILRRNNNADFINLRINYYTSLIDFYTANEQYQNALIECDNAFAYIELLDPQSTKNKINYRSYILYRSATIHFYLGNYDKALLTVNTGIAQLSTFFDNLSSNKSILYDDNINSSTLPELQALKSRIQFHKYIQDGGMEQLETCFIEYERAIGLMNKLKLSMLDEGSKVFATSKIIELYNEAVYIGRLLFEQTGNQYYLEKSFEFAESSKSFALFSEIKNLEAMEFSDLPAEVKEKENRLQGEKKHYEEMLFEEQLKANPDSQLINLYGDMLFQISDDYDELTQEIEANNSKYYDLKYNLKFVSLQEVQDKLPYREALIEYVLTDSTLITFVIDRKGINAFSNPIGEEFSSECMEYYRMLHEQNFSNGVHENYRNFVYLGRKLYKILIEPCLQYTDRKSLTIVPDGAIMYIPFESLLEADADDEYINYMTLPYMIRDYSIGYSHSSTLRFSKRIKTKSPENKVLAFAPEYKEVLREQTTLADNRQIDDSEEILFPLPGIIKEVQSINATVPSRIFLNEKATEANFKKFASDYNVLHLAMHTIMRDDEPLYSHLAFTNMDSTATTEDNKLYAYEIYNMKLNAQMAVLSSCSSGFGKMQKGEGMMSLARGFIYAGCPSIIMTLWQVSDQSSSELMTLFYRYLKKGKSKQESMRLAKLNYLETADDLTSNPYFWSAFVVVGDGSPIYKKSGVAYWMIVVTLFIGMLLIIQYRKS